MNYPKCKEHRIDCLCFKDYKAGICTGLVDVDFTRPCPFYCNEEMLRAKVPKDIADDYMSRKRRGVYTQTGEGYGGNG